MKSRDLGILFVIALIFAIPYVATRDPIWIMGYCGVFLGWALCKMFN